MKPIKQRKVIRLMLIAIHATVIITLLLISQQFNHDKDKIRIPIFL